MISTRGKADLGTKLCQKCGATVSSTTLASGVLTVDKLEVTPTHQCQERSQKSNIAFPQRGLIYSTEQKPLGHLCKMCDLGCAAHNSFPFETGIM
jgi:hypothetical protein